MRKPLLLVAPLLLLACGCTQRVGQFTLLSTKNVELSRVDMKKVDIVKNVKGTDSVFWFLFIPFGSLSLERAVDNALQNGRGDFLNNAVISSSAWTAILVGQTSIEVQGDVVNSIGQNSLEIKKEISK